MKQPVKSCFTSAEKDLFKGITKKKYTHFSDIITPWHLYFQVFAAHSLMSTITTLIQAPVYDYDAENDMDGLDLQIFASGFSGSPAELADFSYIFGSHD